MNLTDGRLTRNKYRAVRVKVDGIAFDSKRESIVYGHLKIMERAGEIEKLMVHFPYTLNAYGGQKVGSYVADFVFFDKKEQRNRTWDVKGVIPALSAWKIKHCEAQYKIKVEIIK